MENTSSPQISLVSGLLLAVVFSLLIVPRAFAAEEPTGAPHSLQEWAPWVLHNQAENTCTLRSTDPSTRFCSWPSRLLIDIAGNGAGFRQEWLIEVKSLVALPGSRKLWPDAVKDADKPLVVIDHNGVPSVWLEPGRHVLTGRFSWEHPPEYLDIPPASGLVFWKHDTPETPHLDADGKLWLRGKNDATAKNELDQASLQVFRKIQDTIPLLEEIHIILTISGAPRELTLGLQAKDGFLPLQVASPLPARIDHQGRLSVQVRPGQWQLDLVIRSTSLKPIDKLTLGTIDGIWPEQEIWVFEAAPKYRQVAVENVSAVDPARTSLPANWMNLPAYLMHRHDTLVLTEKSRGNPQTVPDRLSLTRTLWLDEKGTGLTAQDIIQGTMTKGWRLNADPEQHLGKVEVDGESQLITQLPESGLAGIEVRKGTLSLAADSRIEQPVRGLFLTFPAIGWGHPVQQLTAHLNLPPGWRLLTAFGVDKVSTWLNTWTLLDIFLVLIISFATAKILGTGRGILALVTLILLYHQPESPRHLWLPLLALLAIGSKLAATRGKVVLRNAVFILLALLTLQSLPFMIREIRIGIFPQLEKGPYFKLTADSAAQPQKPKQESVDALQALPPPAGRMYSLAPAPAAKALVEKIASDPQIDPQAMIQTGPGLPNWRWQQLALTWNGPVNPGQSVRLVLLSPTINCMLAFLRVGCLTLLLIAFFYRSLNLFPLKKSSVGALVPLLLFLLALSGAPSLSAAGEIPPPEMLQELQDRLLAPPDCKGECASLDSCRFSLQSEKLHLLLTVHAVTDTAVALPGDSRTFSQIMMDGAPAGGIRVENGTLILRVPQGIHQVDLEKDVKGLSTFILTFPEPPHRTLASVNNWEITGLHPDGSVERQITFKRIEAKQRPDPVASGTDTSGTDLKVPPFFEVERILHLGLKWTVETRIIRKSPGTSITADVPLLPGEMPTSESLYIDNRKVQVNLGPKEETFNWQSVLQASDSLTLTAPHTSDWTETWRLDVSPIWHVVTTGIPEVSQVNPAGLRFPEYRPYPGESLQLHINRPEGIPGSTTTISASRLTVKPGIRSTDSTLHFTLAASRGTRQTIGLPKEAELQKVVINEKELPLQLNGSQLVLPVQPGNQRVEVQWRSRKGLSLRERTPRVDLGQDSVNATLHMEVPSSRWILMTGGPRIGPAVLFWGEILVIVLLAVLLGRTRYTPLSTVQWLLLGLGLSQVHVIFGFFVVGWLFLLGIRKTSGPGIVHASSHNLLQLAIIAATFFAGVSLIYAVQKGLLGDPDMQIGGNGSLGRSLYWYQDRNSPIMPQAWVLSAPLLLYRGLMLAWAIWLSLALLKWLSWGWACFSDGGIWRQEVQPAAPEPEPASMTTKEPKLAGAPEPTAEPPAADAAATPRPKRSWFARFRKR